jgi:hypothetical protein
MKKSNNIISLANVAEGVHATGRVTRQAEAVIVRNQLLKKGSAARTVVPCGANDKPLYVAQDDAAIGDILEVAVLGAASGTLLVTVTESVAEGDDLHTAADGESSKLSAAAGTYYRVGRVISGAGATDLAEIAHEIAQPVVVTE